MFKPQKSTSHLAGAISLGRNQLENTLTFNNDMGNLISDQLGKEPDKPDPVSGMSPRDIQHVQKTWAFIKAQTMTNGMELFLRFFRRDPNAQAFFKRVRGFNEDEIRESPQFKAHVQNVMASIDSAVVNLGDPQVVEALMSKLGNSHCAFKVHKAQFEVFREVLVEMLQNDLNVSENVLTSWGLFVDFIYKPIYEKLKK